VFFTVFASDLGARSSVIKFMFPLLLSICFYFRYFVGTRMLSFVSKVFFILPLVFLILGYSNTFNIFNFNEYLEPNQAGNYSSIDWRDADIAVTADTRSGLYKEVYFSSNVYESWLVGRSPSKGNLSSLFGYLDVNGRGERYSNEVAVLNIITWTGIIGLILYTLVFYYASKVAILYSNNYYIKLIGVYISFRWAYSWVEDFTSFNVGFVLLWLVIGMCYSSEFRQMSDVSFQKWIDGIFRK
jgi:hypothetical protein